MQPTIQTTEQQTTTQPLPLLSLPDWVAPFQQQYKPTSIIEERMAFVIQAAEQNVRKQTGGPFAAAIFEEHSGELVSLGVNLVTSHNNAILHAEIVAIMLAQQKCKTFNLGDNNSLIHELVSSSEPCAMCIGATNWSGVQRLVFGATIEDAQAIGFDEGPVSPNWRTELQQRGIAVIPDILRDKAVKVLNLYQQTGGLVYNGGETHS